MDGFALYVCVSMGRAALMMNGWVDGLVVGWYIYCAINS